MIEPLDPLYFPLILDVLDQGVFTVDEANRILSFNRTAERITGHSAADVLGKRCSEVFRTDLCDQVCPLRQSIRSRRAVRNQQVYIRTRDGAAVPISVSTAPLVTTGGTLLGGVEVFRDLSEITALKRQLDGRYHLADIVGKSPAMQRIFELLPLVAHSDSTVLVTGPSGTGKELAARTIHSLGPRAKGPFVAINCAAIPETLLESELFGHVKGAFTGAAKDRKGRIAAAEGGTLFLDEIGDLPRAMQVKVLRFLQDRSYTPLGSDREVQANVRVISATHQDLSAMIRDGSFREDLYFRLNVVQVPMPPLARRPEDIALLVKHFVRFFREQTGKPIECLTAEAMACLTSYPFPGNVRELENVIERAFILCQDRCIGAAHLPPELQNSTALAAWGAPVEAAATDPDTDTESLRALLARHGGNVTRAAAELGVHRVTLHRRLQRVGLR